ncbi:MAG TPA: hypothetical protein VD997_13935 [Phycisphaerales bacterium]|nr:hypothetical protein [Phycisphaerales bacterium]
MFHARQTDAARMHYRIWPIAECWRRMGIKVDVVFGIDGENERTLLNADLLVPHVDCSVRPPAYQAVIERHPRVLNRRLTDIRKRTVARLMGSPLVVTRADVEAGYDGPVIVKTDGNCGGLPDYHYSRGGDRGPTLLDKVRRRVCNHALVTRHAWLERRSYRWARTLTRYPIYESARDVPAGVWANPSLVVERFVPERVAVESGLHYVMRMWIVMGESGTGRTLTAADAYVKDRHARLAHFSALPAEAASWRERLGVDYGKLDYVVPRETEWDVSGLKARPPGSGSAVLLDVNPTPTVSGDAFSEFYVEQCAPLARGAVEWAEGASLVPPPV